MQQLEETQKKHETQQLLPATPDAEELSFLAEEAERLCKRLDATCNRILYGRPHNSTLLHWVAQELRAHTSTIRWWLEHHGQGS